MKLQILIPTFNRAEFLSENVKSLCDSIVALKLENDVGIIVSNNASTDATSQILGLWQERLSNCSVRLDVFNHCSNIGLESNALFVLEQAISEYVMYLGDDDYICSEYLAEVISVISKNRLWLICPAFKLINLNGKCIGGRDLNSRKYECYKGEKSALFFAWRGHQMSGVVHRRPGLLEAYMNSGASNLYPFVFFTLRSSLNGNACLLPDFPVKVTRPPQKNKDWTYGDDGLISDFVNNFKCYPGLSSFFRFRLELSFLRNQYWRAQRAIAENGFGFFRSIARSKNLTFVIKSYILLYLPFKLVVIFGGIKFKSFLRAVGLLKVRSEQS